MKNYAVLADLRVKTALNIEKAFDRGYERGYNDCKVELLEDEAKCHYQEGYNDGYRKGAERGKEARVAEADCAYQCGMNRAWEAARKIVLSDEDGGIPNNYIPKIYNTSYYGVMKSIPVQEVISKLEAWEQKQEQSKKCCKDCNHYCGDDNKFKCDIKGLLCIERDRWTPKQEQIEKSCSTCANLSEEGEYTDFCWDECDNLSEWTPKQDAPETNVGSIENRDKIVKALAGLLAAYGDQIWDVAADMQKGEKNAD